MEAEVTSVEEKGSLVVDARVENKGNTWAGSGANPWHLDSNTESMLFLTDMSDKPAPIGFSVTANGVHYYLTELTLQPHETRIIDLRNLRDAQIPDFKGNKIPAGATDGSVDWIRLANVAVSGRLMVINRRAGMTSSYDCSDCCCPGEDQTLNDSPNEFDAIQGDQIDLTSTAGFMDCDNNWTYYDVTLGASWSSNDTSVCSVASAGVINENSPGSCTITAQFISPKWVWDAGLCAHAFPPIALLAYSYGSVVSVSISGPNEVPLRASGNSGPDSVTLTATPSSDGGTYSWSTSGDKVTLTNTTSQSVTVTSTAASTAINDVSVTVTYTLDNQHAKATQDLTVEKPTSLQVESDSTNPTGHTCTGGSGTAMCSQSYFPGTGTYTSYLRNRTYHIMDQFNPSRWIQGYALAIQESYTPPTGRCAGPPVNIGKGSGDTITDCFYFCSATCQSHGSCSVSATQTVTVNGFAVATKSVNWTCTGVTVTP
ncbi:MAG: hypothetical protein ACRD3T_17810 [Terriglobia bacterium]